MNQHISLPPLRCLASQTGVKGDDGAAVAGKVRGGTGQENAEMIIETGETVAAVFLGLNAVLDMKKRRISLVSAGAAGAAGIALHIYGGQRLAYVLLGAVPGLLLILLSLFSRGAVGMGDGIAAAAAGLLISPAEILASCGAGSLFAAGFAAIVWLRHRRGKEEMPFVPFLCAGYAAILLIKICAGA